MKFLLVGPEREKGILEAVKAKMTQEKLRDRIVLVGPASGKHKLELFAEATVFLLPSHAENFSLIRAGGCGCGTAHGDHSGGSYAGVFRGQ